MSEPVKGQTAHIVDQIGATFAFGNIRDASAAFERENKNGAQELSLFQIIVPDDNMSWDEVADFACRNGTDAND